MFNDYFSAAAGYIIENQRFKTQTAAVRFLTTSAGMTEDEAKSFCTHLRLLAKKAASAPTMTRKGAI